MHADDWRGLYREGWGSRLRPASFAHPAKCSYGLSVRIYEHALLCDVLRLPWGICR